MRNKLLLTIMILLLSTFTTAFTGLTHKYIAQKTILSNISQDCTEQLFQGTTMPDDSNYWSANPDFIPVNHHCENNDANCEPKQLALKYKQVAEASADCNKALNYGISTHFFTDSLNPAHWNIYEPNCHSNFEKQVEENIKTFKEKWDVSIECNLKDSEEKKLITFTSQDFNQLLTTMSQYYFGTTPQAYEPNIQDTNADNEIRSLIKQLLDENASQEEIKITAQVITEAIKIDCLLPAERKSKLFENYKKLTYYAKLCLTAFTTLESTQAYFFAQQCPQLTGNQDPMYSYYLAQQVLDEYYMAEFAETRYSQMFLPTMSFQQGQPSQQSTGYQIIEYTPKKVKGCVKEFEEWQKIGDEASSGTQNFLLTIIFTASIIVVGVYYILDTSGG